MKSKGFPVYLISKREAYSFEQISLKGPDQDLGIGKYERAVVGYLPGNKIPPVIIEKHDNFKAAHITFLRISRGLREMGCAFI